MGGDPTWGHGKVNALAAVEQAVLLNQVENLQESNEILIYPNPVQDKLFIDIPTEVSSITLKDLSGKIHQIERNGNHVDCNQLQSGIYFISFQSNHRNHVIPFIKK